MKYFRLRAIGLNTSRHRIFQIPSQNWGISEKIFPNFQNWARCEKDLKDNKGNNLHLARKYAKIFVFGHYIICSSKLAVSFEEQIMSASKYPSIFSRQMGAIVYVAWNASHLPPSAWPRAKEEDDSHLRPTFQFQHPRRLTTQYFRAKVYFLNWCKLSLENIAQTCASGVSEDLSAAGSKQRAVAKPLEPTVR